MEIIRNFNPALTPEQATDAIDGKKTEMIELDFQPIGRRVRVAAGSNVLDAARAGGVLFTAVCGGKGSCGSCKVRLPDDADVSAVTDLEIESLGQRLIRAGYRLACQVQIQGPVRIYVPPESLVDSQRIQIESEIEAFDLKPALEIRDVDVQPPALDDLRGDWERLRDRLIDVGFVDPSTPALSVLKTLPEMLRRNKWSLRVLTSGRDVVGLSPLGEPALGLAVDLGTTKIAGYLVDLSTGELLASGGEMNPQVSFGEDVMARISFSLQNPERRDILRSTVVSAINTLSAKLCRKAAIARSGASGAVEPTVAVHQAVIAGNTAMHHLLLGLPVGQLGTAPYVAAIKSALHLPAQAIGLELAPGASVYLPPNLAGFVGGDHTAMLLATGMHRKTGVTLGIDIGTNTEITLAVADRLICCSTASGPAFEGAHIRDGMRAANGAIERVFVDGEHLRVQTVGGKPPVGICGSGILEAIAALRRTGVLDAMGRIVGRSKFIRADEGEPKVVLAPASATGNHRDVLLTREDISEIQLAKGAIRAGIDLLLKETGLTADGIDEVILAGAFGSYIRPADAIEIGMFPPLATDRIRQVGNAAGAGARMTLLSTVYREEAARIAEQMAYLELTVMPEFEERFILSLPL